MIKYNEVFEAQKDSKEWKLLHIKTNSVVCREKTQKKVLALGDSILIDKGEVETLKAIKYIRTKNIKNKLFKRECIKRLFKNTFGQELHKFRDYMMLILSESLCLDIVRFDKFLEVPDGISCKEYIKSKYGIRALKLVEKLM